MIIATPVFVGDDLAAGLLSGHVFVPVALIVAAEFDRGDDRRMHLAAIPIVVAGDHRSAQPERVRPNSRVMSRGALLLR